MHMKTPVRLTASMPSNEFAAQLMRALSGRTDRAAADAGVVERAIEPAEGGDGARYHRRDVRLFGDVAADGDRLAAAAIDQRDRLSPRSPR